MTPAARVQAAIEIIDRIGEGMAAEKALLAWSRGARYAGSKDRRAVRDHVFDVLRRWRSSAVMGGAETGRGRMIGLLRQQEADLETLFTGQGHAPAVLSEAERGAGRAPVGYEAWDLPDWLGEAFAASLGDRARAVGTVLRDRAPVFLRVNSLKATVAQARKRLQADGIECEAADLAPQALRVTRNAGAVVRSHAFLDGLVELQDAASQAVVDALPLQPGMRVLDYCAGGGGKTLAMAAKLGGGPVDAHDKTPARMSDLPVRAARAGAEVHQVAQPVSGYDLVLADVPCSGSGSWRRAPDAKWRLERSELDQLCRVQANILSDCARLVKPGGVLAYATCSVLQVENAAQTRAFLDGHPTWASIHEQAFLPGPEGDGLFVACLRAPG